MLPNDIVGFEIFIFGDFLNELECLCLLALMEVRCRTENEIFPNLMFLGKIWEVFGAFLGMPDFTGFVEVLG